MTLKALFPSDADTLRPCSQRAFSTSHSVRMGRYWVARALDKNKCPENKPAGRRIPLQALRQSASPADNPVSEPLYCKQSMVGSSNRARDEAGHARFHHGEGGMLRVDFHGQRRAALGLADRGGGSEHSCPAGWRRFRAAAFGRTLCRFASLDPIIPPDAPTEKPPCGGFC